MLLRNNIILYFCVVVGKLLHLNVLRNNNFVYLS